jgi:trehalose/maltose hydrolase-like predicted phosphorylase
MLLLLFLLTDPTFLLETHTPTPYTRTYLGNGEIGLSSSESGIQPAQCFMAGVYDHARDDIPRIAVLPAWNVIDIYNGQDWLNPAGVTAYHQTLDMYDGVLRTDYQWAGILVHTETFVSRSDPNLGAVKLEITPHSSGHIKVLLPLRAWPEPKRYPLAKLEKLEGEAARNQWAIWYPGHMIPVSRHADRGLLQMLSKAEGGDATIAEAVALALPEGETRTIESTREAAVEVSLEAQSGQTYTFYKYARISREPLKTGAAKARESAARGYQALLADHSSAWHRLWEADIRTEGDPALQTVVHSMLFYLLGSAGSEFSIPPMGLSSSGYYGHIFWDADTYMFPVLLLLHPEMAKQVVMFRYRTLDAARANAKRNGYKGAMYPWEAGPDGAETTPRFAYQNALYENHVNGDVALAEWQYFLATRDRGWLEQYGYPVIRDTAEFWTSRVTYDRQKDRYEIGKVVSVKESLIGVSNDPYTNAVAKKNLDIATAASKLLGKPANPKWAEISRKMYVPRADLLLIDYPLELPVSAAEKRAAVEKALAAPPAGAMMGVEFYPVLAAELQNKKLIDQTLPRTYLPYIRPPFNVLPETPTNNNTNFITGAGSFLQQFLYGYTGLRLSEEGLYRKYDPLLPSSIRELVLRNVTVRGRRKDLVISK